MVAYNFINVCPASFPMEECSIALAETDIIERIRNNKKPKISKTIYWRLWNRRHIDPQFTEKWRIKLCLQIG